MANKPDFMFTMLSNMVGIPPEEFKHTIEQFIHLAGNIGKQMDRIEANQIKLIEAENDTRRRTDCLPLIAYIDRDGNSCHDNGNTQ